MSSEVGVGISFPGADAATANVLAGELAEWIVDWAPATVVERRRDDPMAQDAGTVLVLAVGTPAAAALARGIAAWLARRRDARLRLRRTTAQGTEIEIVIDGEPSERAERIIGAFLAADRQLGGESDSPVAGGSEPFGGSTGGGALPCG